MKTELAPPFKNKQIVGTTITTAKKMKRVMMIVVTGNETGKLIRTIRIWRDRELEFKL